MKNSKIKLVVFLGLLGILGILAVQLFWFKQAFNLEERKFEQQVHIALLEVVKLLYGEKAQDLPLVNPVKQISKDYYVVDINKDFKAEILDFYLKSEFQKSNIQSDFDYAIYDCNTEEMVYGGKVQFSQLADQSYFPKFEGLVYYFAVRFPNRTNFIFASMELWVALLGILSVILLIYVYSIFVILQQKKFAELQKDFINNMTHEFKTPLSSILIASNYLGNQQKISDDPKLKKYNQIILEQGKKLDLHVSKILSLAKTEYQPLKLNKSSEFVFPILEEIKELMALKYPEADLCLRGKEYESLQIDLDKEHFMNVMTNLVGNAIKYSGQTPQVSIELENKEGNYGVKVSDRGKGIPANKLKHIFKKFYRVTETSQTSGFGLGLFYVKKVCDLHGFSIEAESKVGEGTTILIRFNKK